MEKLLEIAKALGVSVADLYNDQTVSKIIIEKPPKHQRIGKLQEVFERLTPGQQRSVLGHAKALLKV